MPADELLKNAALGRIGVDHGVLRQLIQVPVDQLVRFALEPRPYERIDLTDLFLDLIRHHGHPAAATAYYIEALRRNPDDPPDELIEALAQSGPAALEPLLALYEELGEEQGEDVAFLLARLGVRDQRILTLLLDRLEFEAAGGAFCLGIYGDEAARPALEAMLAEIPEEDTELRREISVAIDLLSAPSAPPEPGKPEEFNIFAAWPAKSLPVFDVLNPEERREMLHHEDSEVRAEAAASFVNEEMTGDLKAELRAILADESRPLEERAGAAVGLAGEEADAALLTTFYEAGEEARARALEAMWRSGDRVFADYFPRHLDDPDDDIARQAIWGVGHLGLGTYAERLRGYFDDHDLRSDALFNYALSVPGETTRARARTLLRKIDEAAVLSRAEAEMVMIAIDARLERRGLKPVFSAEDQSDEEPAPVEVRAADKPGRNDPCPCGSGKKYKKCCGA